MLFRARQWPTPRRLLPAVWMLLVIPSATFHIIRRTSDCAVPSWTVDTIDVTYSNETYTPGTASFVLSNTLTNSSESLTCPLTFNTLCQILGTPGDETLQVLLQVNIDVAFMTLNQSWTCHDQTTQITTYVNIHMKRCKATGPWSTARGRLTRDIAHHLLSGREPWTWNVLLTPSIQEPQDATVLFMGLDSSMVLL